MLAHLPHHLTVPPRAATLVLASLGFVSLGLPEGMLGVAWPSISTTFSLPLDALGLLLATFASGYFCASALSGRVMGRFGTGSVLAVSCGLTGTSLLGYAVAPGWYSMVALGGVLGLGAGTIDAGLNTYAAVAHGPRVLNWMHAAFGLGAAVGPLIMTAILASGLPWNLGYGLVALAQLGLSAGYWRTRTRFGTSTSPHATSDEPDARHARRLLRSTIVWVSVALFFVYCGLEAGAGQWSYSLFTLSRGAPAALAGALVSAYWASLTIGRILFGALVTRISVDHLIRGCMLLSILAALVIWQTTQLASLLALAVLGLSFAPVFPVLIAQTPARIGPSQTANLIGLQVAAAVLGGAALPALVGVVATRQSLEVVGAFLVLGGLVQFALHELLLRSSRASDSGAALARDDEVRDPEAAQR